ncbi:hypothetical protein CHCC20335_0877 [Bacillus paralicheniformis]|nr:hypothetical protein CHCC20335_0877 [Bacillus paralicheniformis]
MNGRPGHKLAANENHDESRQTGHASLIPHPFCKSVWKDKIQYARTSKKSDGLGE